jgi:RNA polymerase-binding transcription factor DksA
MAIDVSQMKEKLLSEKATLEGELKTVGRINPDNPKDWEPTPPLDGETADDNVQADRIEEYEEHTAILKQLEIRYNSVLHALKNIEDGSYGVCEVSGEPIEEERLLANPAARTCTKHMHEENRVR